MRFDCSTTSSFFKSSPPSLSFSSCPFVEILFYSDSTITSTGFEIFYELKRLSSVPMPPVCVNYCQPVVKDSISFCLCDQTPTAANCLYFPDDCLLNNPIYACGRDVFFRSFGLIQSPNFPMYKYDSYLDCAYFIMTPKNSFVVLNFESLELKSSRGDSCRNWVKMFCLSQADSATMRFCGTLWTSSDLLPIVYFRSCTNVLVRFHSDNAIKLDRFSLRYRVFPNACINDCLPTGTGDGGYHCQCDHTITPPSSSRPVQMTTCNEHSCWPKEESTSAFVFSGQRGLGLMIMCVIGGILIICVFLCFISMCVKRCSSNPLDHDEDLPLRNQSSCHNVEPVSPAVVEFSAPTLAETSFSSASPPPPETPEPSWPPPLPTDPPPYHTLSRVSHPSPVLRLNSLPSYEDIVSHGSVT